MESHEFSEPHSSASKWLNPIQMGRDLFPGGECEVFYTVSVAPPK